MSELGQALKDAREAKGMSLDDLQEETKIQKRYLRAIEEGNFDQLPGDFYTRAFIKSYAEAVDLNFSTFAEQFASEMPKTHREPSGDIHTMPPDGTDELPVSRKIRAGRSEPGNWSALINKAIIVVILLIVLMIAYILITNIAGNQSSRGSGSNQGADSSISYSGNSAQKSDSSGESSSSSSSSSASSSEQQTLKLDQTEGTTSTYTLTGTTDLKVAVSTKNGGPAWFMATDVQSGKMIAQGTVSNAGQKTYSFDASDVRSLKIKFGSVPNTVLKINGQSFDFPTQNTVQNITINFSK